MSAQKKQTASGFTLLELMAIVALILILASFAVPGYHAMVVRARETVLKDDLFTIRKLIDQYTLDNQRPPESLNDLVQAGYLPGGLPADPITGSNQTWQSDIDEVATSPEESVSGVVNVHSGSNATSLEGTPYNTW